MTRVIRLSTQVGVVERDREPERRPESQRSENLKLEEKFRDEKENIKDDIAKINCRKCEEEKKSKGRMKTETEEGMTEKIQITAEQEELQDKVKEAKKKNT